MNGYRSRRPEVDVLVLCRPETRLSADLMAAIERQRGVRVRLHLEIGRRQSTDRNRWQTIARGRNALRQRGSAPWAMFVDDDVHLHPDCVRLLVDALAQSPTLGAIAADSAGEQLDPGWSGHVGMAACLFRRSVLEQLEFRSTEEACECWCCCEDLRKAGIGITYCSDARATHLKKPRPSPGQTAIQLCGQPMQHASAEAWQRQSEQAVVLAAFDRRDIGRFESPFVHSLRAWGNKERVIAVAYGLYPSELGRLRRLPQVDVIERPANGVMTPVRRLDDFAEITQRMGANVPVAYWDVADVLFQSSLMPLWNEVLRRPDKLLAVVEPKSYPENGIIRPWSLSIRDPYHRARALELLSRNGFLNSGFAAGTAATMHAYFAEARQMRQGPRLAGTSDWGDQMCLNLYCHSVPGRWHAIHEGWNYCVHDRPPGEVSVASYGIVTSRRIGKIPVVHGNARSLRQFSLPLSSAP